MNNFKEIFSILTFSTILLFGLTNATVCSCGTHDDANGIYQYTVGGPDCCDSAVSVGGFATQTTYIPQGGGVYMVDEWNIITDQAGQDACCDR